MGSHLVVEYRTPRDHRLYFVTKKSGDGFPEELTQEWAGEPINKFDYFHEWGFTDDEEIRNLPEYVIANLTGFFVRTFWRENDPQYRWGIYCGPEHSAWIHRRPREHGFTDPFLVTVEWSQQEFKDYIGAPSELVSVYRLEPYGPPPEDPDAYDPWKRIPAPKQNVLKQYKLDADASWRQLANASRMPVVAAHWNPLERVYDPKRKKHKRTVPTIDTVYLPE